MVYLERYIQSKDIIRKNVESLLAIQKGENP